MSAPRRVAVVGATASGKSALAHAVALELDLELATVDSMTVYREMDIGTAKPTARERSEVRYHLLDLVAPSKEFTVAAFQRAAREAAADVAVRSRRLLYVGGTGLYGRAVLDDLVIPGEFPAIRASLEATAAHDLASLYEELVRVDPAAAARTTPTNARRIVRALEVIRGTGRTFSSFGAGLTSYPDHDVAMVGLEVDDDELDHRIAARFHRWLEQGLRDEARRLYERTPALSRTARQAVGYRQLFAHFDGAGTYEVAVTEAITATRRLARRQRRWFRRDPRVAWFTDPDEARRAVIEMVSSAPSMMGD